MRHTETTALPKDADPTVTNRRTIRVATRPGDKNYGRAGPVIPFLPRMTSVSGHEGNTEPIRLVE